MSGSRAALVLSLALLVGGLIIAYGWPSSVAPPEGPAPGAEPAAPSLTPSELEAPLRDALVQALAERLQRTTLPTLEAKVLLAPHARDPGRGGKAAALTAQVMGADPERVLMALFPCRQACEGVERGALSLDPLCPAGARWLDDPGRKMARFEGCRTEEMLVVRPDGPTGAVVVLREQGLPAIFREVVARLAEPAAGLSGQRLDPTALRAAVTAGTGDKRLGQALVAHLDKPLSGKDRRGDAFVLTPVLSPDGQGLCGARLVVSPGYKMSQRAWPRRYFIDASALFAHEHLPQDSFRLASGRDLKLTLEVRAAGCR